MSITASKAVIELTDSADLATYRERAATMLSDDREIVVSTDTLSTQALQDLGRAAATAKDGKTARAIESILHARSGRFDKPIPNFKALSDVLKAYLKHQAVDGWVYVTDDDGKLYPEIVVSITHNDGMSYGRQSTPSVEMRTFCYGLDREQNLKAHHRMHTFSPQTSVNRRVADILAAQGIFKETLALRRAADASLATYHESIQNAYAKQFRVNGPVLRFEENDYSRRGEVLANRRAIHDLKSSDFGPSVLQCVSTLLGGAQSDEGLGEVPVHPVVKVFDLSSHEFLWVHADALTPHVYDKSLRNKLVLPESHRDLLDVLTTDMHAFVADFVEDKSSGNVILCKGIPGVGKTLTAEVYAELTDRPLYSVRSGELGTTAAEIATNLRVILHRSKAWDCICLIDEADVFVTERGDNIEQNAIVAEFLRTLEYHDTLLFLTTNRASSIDEAIISRCAAIIDYGLPTPGDAAAIWRVMSDQFQARLDATLIEQLVGVFPTITPRDIKMLLRLALRVAKAHDTPLDIEVFRRCAMFRAIQFDPNGKVPARRARCSVAAAQRIHIHGQTASQGRSP